MNYINDYDYENYEKLNQKITDYMEINNIKSKKQVSITELKQGQLILIDFLPYSQKYIYKLYSKIGTIQEINHDGIEGEYDIRIKNIDGHIENILHPSVSYYGDTLGYEYTIYLLE